MEVTKWLKPSISVSRIGDSASVAADHGGAQGDGSGSDILGIAAGTTLTSPA